MSLHPPGIVRDPAPLEDGFIPETLVGREAIRQTVVELLGSGRKGVRPIHAWLHGPPGSGKTACVQKAMAELEERRVRTAYVNCWSNQTFYAVLEAVFQDLRALVDERPQLAFKYDRLSRLARQGPLVLVLDEVDSMFLKERNAALYNLAQLDHAGLVCLSESRNTFQALDSRVQSRLQPRFIEFPVFKSEELASILRDRAHRALAPEVWCEADLGLVAQAAQGDARIAIQSLRTASYLAEKARATQVRATDLHEGIRQASTLKRRYVLRSLSEQHRLLHQLVQKAGEISRRDLWIEYKRRAGDHGLETMAPRTFSNYLRHLIENRLLEERQGRGRKNERILRVVKE